MRVLFISPIDMTTEVPITSLVGHDVLIHRYGYAQVPVDRGMLDAVDAGKPDLIVYIGSNDPQLMAQIETFRRLRGYAPTVLLCHDASDATWTPVLTEYARHDAFSLVVAIDGNDQWPKRKQDFTALTPVPATLYSEQLPIAERLVSFGFAGGYSSPSRRAIVEHLQAHCQLVVPRRNERYGSYHDYARFLLNTKIVLNVPWSGSDNAVQVKGRVLEAGHAGCVLLEHATSATRHWFNPGIDYAVYHDKEDAVEQVRALIADPEWMDHLAQKLHSRVTTEYSAERFWAKVFKRVGLC